MKALKVAAALIMMGFIAVPRNASAANLLGASGGITVGPNWGPCYEAGPGIGVGTVTGVGVIVGPGVHTLNIARTFFGGTICPGGVGKPGDTGVAVYTLTWVKTSGATSTWVVVCEKHLGGARICIPV